MVESHTKPLFPIELGACTEMQIAQKLEYLQKHQCPLGPQIGHCAAFCQRQLLMEAAVRC